VADGAIMIDGAIVASFAGKSATYNWNTSQAKVGGHTLQSKVQDAAEFFMDLEDQLGVQVPDNKATEMKKIGDLAKAEKASSEAIALMRAMAEKPGAGPYEWNAYANTLLKSEIESFREPVKALELALRASRATKDSNATFLDTLAWAYFRNGDAASAIRTERQAMLLVPAGDALGQGLRSELEEGLAQFENVPKK
jgi:tetratricopeptide (TPR) repeat protein